jgi:hypothetical protein
MCVNLGQYLLPAHGASLFATFVSHGAWGAGLTTNASRAKVLSFVVDKPRGMANVTLS